jgi:hypothetical protein
VQANVTSSPTLGLVSQRESIEWSLATDVSSDTSNTTDSGGSAYVYGYYGYYGYYSNYGDDYVGAIANTAVSVLKSPAKQAQDANTQEFGTLFAAIGNEILSVLSSNPFLVNPADAVVVIALVSGIFFFLLAGSIYFGVVDKRERKQMIDAKVIGVQKKEGNIPKEEMNRRKLSLAFYGGGVSERYEPSAKEEPAVEKASALPSVNDIKRLAKKLSEDNRYVSSVLLSPRHDMSPLASSLEANG